MEANKKAWILQMLWGYCFNYIFIHITNGNSLHKRGAHLAAYSPKPFTSESCGASRGVNYGSKCPMATLFEFYSQIACSTLGTKYSENVNPSTCVSLYFKATSLILWGRNRESGGDEKCITFTRFGNIKHHKNDVTVLVIKNDALLSS